MMEKSGLYQSSVQKQRMSKEVVEDIMIKKEIKPTGAVKKGLKKFPRKFWHNDRHVEEAEIDALFCSGYQPYKPKIIDPFKKGLNKLPRKSWNNITQVEEPIVERQRKDPAVSKKKETKPEVDETDAVFKKEFQSSKSKKSQMNAQKQKSSASKEPLEIAEKKESKPQELNPGTMQSLLGGGGYVLG
ncbi:uncharacterized protein [Halyomorpha halys]|uniref:uncharacterized protein isoform X1 n=1 Tax=Halyomorpha halys TaxID=286706 RepID=UPI0006D50202|nr:uncharacterized protein LOC106684344 isoform X1 [Halyomorpha halys]